MTAISEFNLFVEKAVRPIQVPRMRKMRMRDELLSHMNGIYDQLVNENEIAEKDAVKQAILRMGDPSELTHEFKKEESIFNSLHVVVEHFRYDPREKFCCFLLRHSVFGVLLAIFVIVFVSISLYFRRPDLGTGFAYQVALFTVSVHFCFAVPFLLLVDPVARSFHNLENKPSRFLTGVYLLLSMLIIPTIGVIINYVIPLGLGIESGSMLFAVIIAPALPLLLAMMSKPAAEEIDYIERWDRIEIEN